jgi:hypothetical protein
LIEREERCRKWKFLRYVAAMIDPSRETRRTMSVGLIGSEQEPLLQIDGMLADPERLLQSADRIAFAPAFSAAGGYPGLRAAAPRAYVEHMVQTLTGPIARAFGLGKIRPTKADCAFSIVTLPPDRLAPAQRAPHVDTTNRTIYATRRSAERPSTITERRASRPSRPTASPPSWLRGSKKRRRMDMRRMASRGSSERQRSTPTSTELSCIEVTCFIPAKSRIQRACRPIRAAGA